MITLPPPPPPDANLLTTSRIQTAKTCLKKHWFAYQLLLRKVKTAVPLSEGAAFHKALETYDLTEGGHETKKFAGLVIIAQRYATYPAWCESSDDRYEFACEGYKMAAMFEAHCDHWVGDGLNIVATEHAYNLPLINPATGHASTNFRKAGKIDRIVQIVHTADSGKLMVQEYKTTSDDISVGANYWKKLSIDSQLSEYILAARAEGYAIDSALYDVTRKSDKRPYKATPLQSRKYTKDGKLYANQRETNEDPEDYGRRVYEAVMADPDRHFARVEIARLDSDLREHQYDVWAWQRMIRESQINDRWPRNSGACTQFGSLCPYFELCTGGWTPDQGVPDGFRVAKVMHEELVEE